MDVSDLCYLIHSRPYRETSQILTLFARDHGRVSAVQRGARRAKGRGFQPFCLVAAGWYGRGELKSLKVSETLESPIVCGRHLLIGLYLNEVLERLLKDGQPVAAVFDRYHHLVQQLARPDQDAEPLLRSFEYALLGELGYGFALDRDGLTGEAVLADALYRFYPQQGLRLCSEVDPAAGYRGQHLLAMADMNYSDGAVRLAAKKLMRQALAPHLGTKPLVSRELFRGQAVAAGAGK